MMVTKQFTDWLRRQFYVERDEGICSKLILRHVGADKKSAGEVLTIKVPKQPTEDFLEEQAQELINAAEIDANGIGGIQSYVVHAYFKDSPEKPCARFALRVAAADDEDGSGEALSSEPATKQGLLSQLMRHNEANSRVNTAGFGQIVNAQQRMIGRLEELVEKLVTDRMENMNAMEGLLSQKNERDIATREAENKMKLQSEVAEKLLLLAPMVVNKLSGNKMLPEKNVALQTFLESLDAEQLEVLQKTLRPEQMLVVMDMMQAVQNGKEPAPSNGLEKEGSTRGH